MGKKNEQKNEIKTKPQLLGNLTMTWDIDDVDGQIYMLNRNFGGCLTLSFDRPMDEKHPGRVTFEGKEVPGAFFGVINAFGGMHLLGIPVRNIFTTYDTDYELTISDFADEEGTVMDPALLKVHTLAAANPDPAYKEHDAVALKAAEEGIVLLKNEGNILPLQKGVALSLCHADDFRMGPVGAGKISPRCSFRLERALRECSDFMIEDGSDVVLYVLSRASGENYDNEPVPGYFYLTKEEEAELSSLQKKEKQVIAIINSGYPMDLRWLKTYGIKAALWCGFPGMYGAVAIAKILDGRVAPSGKLPDTWSLDYWDIPASRNFYHPRTPDMALDADCNIFVDTWYEEGIYVGYRYFETFHKEVAYPFGFGLSYTTFSLDADYTGNLHDFTVTVSVKNTGEVPGKEVVQVYAAIAEGKLEQPSLRLIGFAKTDRLEPGKEEVLFIQVKKDALTSFDEESAAWVLEPGAYRLFVGESIKDLSFIGAIYFSVHEVIKQSEHLMQLPVSMDVFSKRKNNFPKGEHTGIKKGVTKLLPRAARKHYPEKERAGEDFVDSLSDWELARLSVCGSHGWGMEGKGEAGRVFQLEGREIPLYRVADGNNAVNVNIRNLGMPCSNSVCASWNRELAYDVGRVIGEEAKEYGINMILAPAMNIHRDPLNGRHPEYFSEDPFLAGSMAGHQGKGLEEAGVSSCIKHVLGNNSEASRKRNQSLIPERALREIYLKAFMVALDVYMPSSLMTGYNAVNGCFTASDEELLQGIFRGELGFSGYIMTDWNSYESAGIVEPVQAGNCWLTPGSADDTYVSPILEALEAGVLDRERLKANVRHLLLIVQKQTKKDLGVRD